MSAEFSNAFCIVRPPGHHAEYDVARGFCFFNNVAIAARHLLQSHKLERIMIIDVDVHHGNGAQHSFYDDSRVLVCNVHRKPTQFYPYNCGFENEIGSGLGEGYNLNLPLEQGSGPDQYNQAISTVEKRASEFQPQFIPLSMGFDAHETDNMGGMNLPTGYFGYLTERLKKIANQAEGKMVSVLEGGYVRESIADCSAVHLRQLLLK